MNKLIRDKLRQWREENDLSRAAVALMLHVSPRTIEAWEQGKAAIPERAATQIQAMMESVETLEIPLTPELKEQLKKVRAAGHDPQAWAAELLGKFIG